MAAFPMLRLFCLVSEEHAGNKLIVSEGVVGDITGTILHADDTQDRAVIRVAQ